MTKEIREGRQRLPSWAGLFDAASIEEKNMAAADPIKAVTCARDYGIEVELSLSEARYLSGGKWCKSLAAVIKSCYLHLNKVK